MQITITNISKLKASLICAAKKDPRFYLNGVLIEIHAEHVLLVSTDGHRLSIIRSLFAEASGEAIGHKIIIPRELIESFLRSAKKGLPATIHFEPFTEGEVNGYELSLHDGSGLKISGRTIEGTFPDWRKVYNTQAHLSEERKPLSVNAAYVGDFGKVAEALGYKCPAVKLTTICDGMYKVDILHEDFAGILMGVRESESKDTSWVK